MKNYDVTVIGSGPGGYVAAIKCAQLGFKTALVEKYNSLGGTCLNVGCIPSKALLDTSEHFFQAKHSFPVHGINISKLDIDFNKAIDRKNDVVKQNVQGLNFLMKKNKIDVITAKASFIDKNTIKLTSKDSDSQIQTKNTIIATGSKPMILPFIKLDKKRVITSTEALSLNEIPKKLIIIGAGVIGLELGSVYARLGAEVTVIEYSDRIAGTMDADLSKELKKILEQELKFKFLLGSKVVGANGKGSMAEVQIETNGSTEALTADYCLVSTGRSAYIDGLGLDTIGVTYDSKTNKIHTNEHLQTNIDNIFAIGDVINGPMLAHKAEEEGVYVAEYLSGQKPHINYSLIPSVIYTWPEVASVGKTEEELKKENLSYKKGMFPFMAVGRARASMDTAGFVKILADSSSDEVLGVHIIGARAADLIAEAVLAMEYRASAEDMARICYAHPTFAEAIKEAALNASFGKAIHM